MSVKHSFHCLLPDSTNPSEIRISNWNADHIVDGVYHSTVTIFAGATFRVFNHNLGSIPTTYSICPLELEGCMWYVTNESATQAQINLATSQDIDLHFKIKCEVL